MRIMLVTSRFPLPPWRGNQLRTIQWLDALADCECLLLCPAGTGQAQGRLQTELRHLPHSRVAGAFGLLTAVARGRPAQEGLYESRAAKRVVADATADRRPDVAVIQMVRCGWAMDAIRAVDPTLPVLFDAIDSMSLHYERAATAAPPLLGSAYRSEAVRCLRRESELVRDAAVTTAVSGRDLRALGAGSRGMVVPVTGGSEARPRTGTDRGATVLLSGNLGYRPTVRGALWFADRVWPGLHDRVPGARWVLAGARPAAAIRRLASRPGIEVHGNVDDLGAFVDRADVAIAPMASGSGVPIKILEAMAAGVPVVVDPWSADGLEDPSAVVVATGEEDWIRVLGELLGDPEAASDQAARGLAAWRAVYRPDRVRARIRQAVDAALSRAG
jgi:glycosyltransferase involved in cell wall biosynthesis